MSLEPDIRNASATDPDTTDRSSTDRQAAFDRRYRLLELKERRADRDLKRRELEISRGAGLSFSAGQATVLAATIALLSAVAGALIQRSSTIDVEAGKNDASLALEQIRVNGSISLEKQKQAAQERLDRIKFETTLILKATEAASRETQIRNLQFFLNAGFITDPEGKIARIGVEDYPSAPLAAVTALRPTGAEAQVSASALSRQASAEALNLVIATEVGSKATYDRLLSHPIASPFGLGGLTIGLGYQLGLVTPAQFRDTWAGHLDADSMSALMPFVGIKDRDSLRRAQAGLSTITITWEQAVDVFLSKTMPEVDMQLRGALPNVGLLPPEAHGALLSLVYERGPAFRTVGDRFTEMRNILAHMESREFSKIPQEIRGMKRPEVSRGHRGQMLIREQEAALFERGFSATPVPPNPPAPAAFDTSD